MNRNPADPLSQVLDRMRLVSWTTGAIALDDNLAIYTPPDLVSFYVAVRGSFQLAGTNGDIAPRSIKQGSYVLLAHGTPHSIFTQVGMPIESWLDAHQRTIRERREQPDRESTIVVHGHFMADALRGKSFAGAFPGIAILDRQSAPALARNEPLVSMLLEEIQSEQAGWQSVVTSMVRTLCKQFVRTYANNSSGSELDNESGNWLRGAADTAIGPVLAMLHESPAKPWTVSLLARSAHMAKSGFSERFRRIVGESPLKYLTGYRITLACQLLRDSDFTVKEIATSVGYQSASSFSNVFKRWTGKSPVEYRRADSAVTDAMQIPTSA